MDPAAGAAPYRTREQHAKNFPKEVGGLGKRLITTYESPTKLMRVHAGSCWCGVIGGIGHFPTQHKGKEAREHTRRRRRKNKLSQGGGAVTSLLGKDLY